MNNALSHIDAQNNPGMVNVSNKAVTQRMAEAEAILRLPREVLEAMQGEDITSPKGPVFLHRNYCRDSSGQAHTRTDSFLSPTAGRRHHHYNQAKG